MPTGKLYLGETLICDPSAGGGGDEWVRPSEWPALTIPDASEQKVTGLYAVWPPAGSTDVTWLAMLFQGAYTVDWGDGTANESFNSNVKCEHQFDWDGCTSAAIDINTATTGTLYYIETLGDTSQADWNTLAGTSGRTYVVGDRITAAVNGSTLSNTTGTVSTVPYRFATVTVTPQAGQNLTVVNLSQETTTTDLVDVPQWLELAISAPNSSSVALRGSDGIEQRNLRSLTIVTCAVTNFTSFITQASALEHVFLKTTGVVSSFSLAFFNCVSLKYVEIDIPSMLAGVGNLSQMFASCHRLRAAPSFNTTNATNAGSMFNNCFALEDVPAYNLAAVTSTNQMFRSCRALKRLPALNTSAATNMAAMFQECSHLIEAPALNTAAATTVSAMFFGCSALTVVPTYNVAAATTIADMFGVCTALQVIRLLNCGNITTTTTAFTVSNGSLHTLILQGITIGFTVSNNNLSAAALDQLYTSLGTASGAQTVVVTGNTGVTGDDETIATAKGWSITS